jgi:hypothetical protein
MVRSNVSMQAFWHLIEKLYSPYPLESESSFAYKHTCPRPPGRAVSFSEGQLEQSHRGASRRSSDQPNNIDGYTELARTFGLQKRFEEVAATARAGRT